MSGYTLREAEQGDLSSLLKLEQKIIEAERPYDSNLKERDTTYYDLSGLISDTDSYLVVVESNGNIVGTGYTQIRVSKECHIHEAHCYLGFIYVENDHRGNLLGSQILDKLKKWGGDRGINNFYLDVYSENNAAIRVYEKIGFRQITVKMELNV